MDTTFNHTELSLDEVAQLAVLKTGRNLWRQRNIRLYQHPHDASLVISDGIAFDGSMRVIAVETRDDWARELDAAGSFTIH